MPLYDYRCTACDHEVEVMHGINDSGPTTCEQCGGTMRKALSAPAIHFKGSGWAKKDAQAASKAKASKSAASATATTATEGTASDASKDGAKPSAHDKSTADTPASGESSDTESSASPSTPAKAATSASD